jgi:Na+-transporting NADH:ubiquinone oxidoreductase subunit NqrB
MSASIAATSMIERVAGAILAFNWAQNWHLVAGVLVGLYFLKVLLYREKILNETRGQLLTLPGLITSAINALVILGIMNIVKMF